MVQTYFLTELRSGSFLEKNQKGMVFRSRHKMLGSLAYAEFFRYFPRKLPERPLSVVVRLLRVTIGACCSADQYQKI